MICSFLEEWLSFFDMESGFSHDIPTTVHRSKADCPEPEEMVTVSVDGAVLDRIGKIMSYLRLGSSGKILKKKKDKDGKGLQEYNREVVDSDDEDDLSKMDMGGRAKRRLHRWDFEIEKEWATCNEQKEAMPKAAFQFGVKMQDGRKTRKQNKDQKITNELHKILAKKNMQKDDGSGDDESHPRKKQRV
ncbi:putative protein RED [Helianthus annuus]|uniref:RED-like N-terminal domain-containing protein n=1 Tax=Helianthus annuus TaxID=4232 RepID=A0A9K3ENA9_HELAN|nr:putative protein RED [Helianthus annuus]KAJ0861033.1 putative protein RED [Helianthus annuus]